MIRKPLAIGNTYVFPGYSTNGFKVTAMSFPETDNDDGGLPGVSIKWLHRNGKSFWYPFYSEKEFWEDIIFKSAVSK